MISYLEPNAPAWSIPAAAIAELEAKKADYENAYEAANIGKKNNRTRQQIKAKEDATAIYKSEIRLFVKRYVSFNNLINDAERLSMGLKVRDIIRTSSSTPSTIPKLFCRSAKGNRVIVTIRQQPDKHGSNSRGKPADTVGFQLAISKDSKPAKSAADCADKRLYSKSPAEIILSPADSGKIITIYGCWIGKKLQTGLWSQGNEAVVPT